VNVIPKIRIPDEAGTHFSTASVADKWIPAFAGIADFQLVTPIAQGCRY